MFDMRIEFGFRLFTIDADELRDDRVPESKTRMCRQRAHCIGRNELFARCEDRNDRRRTDAMHHIPASIFYRLSKEMCAEENPVSWREGGHGGGAGHMALIDGPPQVFTIQAVQTD